MVDFTFMWVFPTNYKRHNGIAVMSISETTYSQYWLWLSTFYLTSMTFTCHFHLFPKFTSPSLIFEAQTLCFNRYASASRRRASRCHPCCWRMLVWKCPALACAAFASSAPMCVAAIHPSLRTVSDGDMRQERTPPLIGANPD